MFGMPRLQVETRHARPGQSNRLDGARSDAMTAESVVKSIKNIILYLLSMNRQLGVNNSRQG